MLCEYIFYILNMILFQFPVAKNKGLISKKVQYNMDITQPTVPITKNVYHSF